MNKIFLITALSLIPVVGFAQDSNIHISIENGKIKAETTNDVNLYNFSADLIHAAENCMPYAEDFTTNNPELQAIGKFMGNRDFNINVKIKGKNLNTGKCEFEIQQAIKGISSATYNCAIDEQQQTELIAAMKDRSTTPVTETYTTYSEMELPDGTTKQIPTQTTQTGGKFKVTLSKIIATSCQTEVKEASEEEQQETAEEVLSFSNDFQNALKACAPAEEVKRIFFYRDKFEILGYEDGACHVRSQNYDYYIPTEDLSSITNITALQQLNTNKDIAFYRPTYLTNGLVDALKACKTQQELTQQRSDIMELNNQKIDRQISVQKTPSGCRVTFSNIVQTDGKSEEYIQDCLINDKAMAYVEEQTKTYQTIPPSVDLDLYNQLQELNICKERKQ